MLGSSVWATSESVSQQPLGTPDRFAVEANLVSLEQVPVTLSTFRQVNTFSRAALLLPAQPLAQPSSSLLPIASTPPQKFLPPTQPITPATFLPLAEGFPSPAQPGVPPLPPAPSQELSLPNQPGASATPPMPPKEFLAPTQPAVPPTSSTSDNNPGNQTLPDPDLGILRLQQPTLLPNAQPPTQPEPTARQTECDPELGCLRLRDVPPPSTARHNPTVFLLARFDYIRSSNVFSGVDPIDDGLLRPGLMIFAAPALGRDTYLVSSIEGNLIRYSMESAIDYNELRVRAGIIQRLSPNMFGEIGWGNQQLFIAGDKIPGLPEGTRFLNDHAIRLDLSRRDQLFKGVSLSTFYQFRLSFADPAERSRVINSFTASLNYDIQSNFQMGLDYQFALANFTQQNREDQYHQLIARLSYTAFRNTQLSLFTGYSFGRSTDPTIDFNGFIFGVSISVNVGLF